MGMTTAQDKADRVMYEPLQWLSPWLNTTFYGKSEHKSQYRTVFCTECMGDPFRLDKERKHEGHKTLKVCRASSRAAIHVDEAKSFLDTSRIHLYTINSRYIVYLVSNVENSEVQKNAQHSCSACKTKLNDKKYEFCSIGCKLEILGINGLRIGWDPNLKRKLSDLQGTSPRSPLNPEERREGMIILQLQLKKKPNAAPVSLRKHRRKGIPIRAPLF